MEAINPFSDPEFKKKLLEKEGFSSDSDYELLEDHQDLKSIISDAPILPKTAKNLILDASAIAKNEKEQKAKEMSLALNNIFSRYNKEYGTDLQINFDSLSNTLINVSDPKSRHVLELYVSEVFKSFRPILILHLMQKLTLAIDYVLDPQRLFGQDMTTQDIFIVVEKLLQYIDQLDSLRSDVEIKGSDLELKKLAEENTGVDFQSEEAQQAISDFWKLFNNDNNGGE